MDVDGGLNRVIGKTAKRPKYKEIQEKKQQQQKMQKVKAKAF